MLKLNTPVKVVVQYSDTTPHIEALGIVLGYITLPSRQTHEFEVKYIIRLDTMLKTDVGFTIGEMIVDPGSILPA